MAVCRVALYMLITYDIACQFFKAFWQRMLGFPIEMRLTVPTMAYIIAKIPKGHIRAHQDSCQGPFSLNFTDGAADTDGEGIERLWSWLNKAAPSGKEMTQAGRHELLDDFCGFSNWKKMLLLCALLTRRMLEALKQATIHWEEFVAFDRRVRENDAAEVARWEHMLQQWKQDNTQPCPYVSSRPCKYSLLNIGHI